jgi:uncharacterized protein YyaL (SSP411 family)
MSNRLASSPSLYLRQHATNPVHWYPWGDEAFLRAKAENKPVIISIGYSSCHWCHVMAHESFEDSYIASLMNDHFVCIKVDREEHPEVDQIYMEAVQMIQGQGGWPLNVFCLPDGRPFAGGTYFPPDDRRPGLVPWPQLLMRVADFFQRNRSDLEENAAAIMGNLAAANEPPGIEGDPLTPGHLLTALGEILSLHDDEFGGFGGEPKFPPASTLQFLLALRASATIEHGPEERRKSIDAVINTTLTAMAHGGIYDQIGGGFSRYSVDRHWLIPHFEKMLYDNGLLLHAYTRAWRRYPKPLYKAVVEETVDFLIREMRTGEGTFMSAIDADSPGGEGSFYTWTPPEIREILGKDRGAHFCETYAITQEGNFEDGRSQPALLDHDFAVREAFGPARAALLAERNRRPRPDTDDKVIVAWNALVIGALAEAAFVFDRREWFAHAAEAADWILREMITGEDQLAHVAYRGEVSGTACLDDYALLAESCLSLAAHAEWFESGSSERWYTAAKTLTDAALERFDDRQAVGFFYSAKDAPHLVTRKKDWMDNALPSGNSSLLHVFNALHLLTGNPRYAHEANRLSRAFTGLARQAPAHIGHALSASTWEAVGMAVLKVHGVDFSSEMRLQILQRPWRPLFIQKARPGEQNRTFQLCVGTQCLEPSDNLSQLVENL